MPGSELRLPVGIDSARHDPLKKVSGEELKVRSSPEDADNWVTVEDLKMSDG